MSDTTFIEFTTPVPAVWLNEINDHVHNDTPISPDTTVHEANVLKYTPSGTGAVATTVQSKLRESVSVKDFGAVGDWNGTTGTDNTTAFTAAVNALGALGGGILYIPPGDYKGRLNINQSNIHVVAYGSTIGFQDIDASLAIYPGATIPFNYSFFGGFDGGGVPANVSANATFYSIDTVTQGSDTFTVLTSAAGLAVGDWCMLMSGQETYSTPSTNHVPTIHQLVQIRDVSGLTIKINGTADASFTSAATYARLVKWNWLENVKVSGASFTNLAGGTAAYIYAISGTRNVVLEDVTFYPKTNSGISSTCQDVLFDNCHVWGAYGGFSHGRMCDGLVWNDCSVSGITSGAATEQFYFLFSEENVKRMSINGCRGNNAGVVISGGSAYTDVSISDSFFEVFDTVHSALGIYSNAVGSVFKINNTTFIGNNGYGAYVATHGVCEIAYTTGDVRFDNCVVEQLDGAAYSVVATTGSTEVTVNNSKIVEPMSGVAYYVGVNDGSGVLLTSETITGTFSPTLSYQTNGDASFTYGEQVAKYVKTGNLVTLTMRLRTTAHTFTTSSGFLKINGIPAAIQPTTDTNVNIALYGGITSAARTTFSMGIPAASAFSIIQASGSGVAAGNVDAGSGDAYTTSGSQITLYLSASYIK